MTTALLERASDIELANPAQVESLRFVDLFAGLGGFHEAMKALGGQCVFASEIDPKLAEIYWKNHGIRPHGDIRDTYGEIPSHDLLCAGFPCQPFSKAGDQLGFDCPQWGDLFDFVLLVLKRHQPKMILIENVPNIVRHDEGRTWLKIEARLREAGYDVASKKVSPVHFGVPQGRDRVIIVGRLKSLGSFKWPEEERAVQVTDLRSILDVRPENARTLSPRYGEYLAAWQRLLSKLPPTTNLSTFPIWAAEFGATYPFEGKAPLQQRPKDLAGAKGAFGVSFSARRAAIKHELPPYARTAVEFPLWKQEFIRANRKFYADHQVIIDEWLPNILSFPPSFQKLEWNWKGGALDIYKGLVQFRASGIRVRRPDVAPSLVALTASQVPVVPWEGRYLTVRECARLQSMDSLRYFPEAEGAAFKALGNAVNVVVVRRVAERLIAAA